MIPDYEITFFCGDKGGGYIAEIPDLEFCSAFGGTIDQALVLLGIAREEWLASAEAEGKILPEPVRRLPN